MDKVYSRVDFVDNVTVLDAARMGAIQDQYIRVAGIQVLDALPTQPGGADVNACVHQGSLHIWDGTVWVRMGRVQVQSDWAQASTTEPSFILNKPVLPAPSDSEPMMDGAPLAGSSVAWARGDHVHPSDRTKADVTALTAGLAPKADKIYVDSGLATKADTASLGDSAFKTTGTSAGNVPILGADGKLSASTIPQIALSEYKGTVATKAELVTLTTAGIGDYAIVKSDPTYDFNGTYILSGMPAVLADWILVSSPGGVTSVNGAVGVVVLTSADVGAVPTVRTVNSKPLSADVTIGQTDIAGLVEDLALKGAKVDVDKSIWRMSNSNNNDGVTWWCTANDGSVSNNKVKNVSSATIANEQCFLTKAQYDALQARLTAGDGISISATNVISALIPPPVTDGTKSWSFSLTVSAWVATADVAQKAEGYSYEHHITLTIPHPELLYPIVSVSPIDAKLISPQCVTDTTGLTVYSMTNAPMVLERVLLISSQEATAT